MKKYMLLAREIVKLQEDLPACTAAIKQLFKTEDIYTVSDVWKLICALAQTEDVKPELLDHLVSSKDFDFFKSPLYASFSIEELRYLQEDAPDLAGKLLCKILDSTKETSLVEDMKIEDSRSVVEDMKYSIKQRLATPLLSLANANPVYFEDSKADVCHYLSDRDYLLIFETLYEYCKRNNIGFKTELLKLKNEDGFLFPDSALIYTLMHCPEIMEYKGLNKLVDRVVPRERFPWSLGCKNEGKKTDRAGDSEDYPFINKSMAVQKLSTSPIYDLTAAVKEFSGSKYHALAILIKNFLEEGEKDQRQTWLAWFGVELMYYYCVTGQLTKFPEPSIADYLSPHTVDLFIQEAYPYAEYREQKESLLKDSLKVILETAPYGFAREIKSLPWDKLSAAEIYAEFTDAGEPVLEGELPEVSRWGDWQYKLLQRWSDDAPRFKDLFALFKIKDWHELIEGGVFFMERMEAVIESSSGKRNLLWDLFNLRDEEDCIVSDELIMSLWEEGIPDCPGCTTYAFPESRLPALFERLLKKYGLDSPLPKREHWKKRPLSMKDVLQASLFKTGDCYTCDYAFFLPYLKDQTFLHWLTSDGKPLFPPKLIEAIHLAQLG